MGESKNTNEQESEVDNRGATYRNEGDVYNAPVSHQTIIQEKSVTYDVDTKDVEGLEKLSRFIIGLLGERNTTIGAAASTLLGTASIFSTVRYADILARFSPYLMYVGFFFILVGAVLFVSLQYKYESRCVKCNTFYSMKEVGEPKVREVKGQGGARRTTTRTYKCSNCAHEVTKKSNEFIEDDPS